MIPSPRRHINATTQSCISRLLTGFDSPKPGASTKAIRWPSRIVIASPSLVPRIFLIGIAFRIVRYLLFAGNGRCSSGLILGSAGFIIVVIVPQHILLHRRGGTLD